MTGASSREHPANSNRRPRGSSKLGPDSVPSLDVSSRLDHRVAPMALGRSMMLLDPAQKPQGGIPLIDDLNIVLAWLHGTVSFLARHAAVGCSASTFVVDVCQGGHAVPRRRAQGDGRTLETKERHAVCVSRDG